MKILGIDQASKCGWCCGDDLYGLWDLRTMRDESTGFKLIRFRNKLRQIHEAHGIDLIVYERVAGQYKDDISHASKLVAVIESFCEENGIEYTCFSASEIKLWATGSGRAKKEDMVKIAQERYGYAEEDDNVADAILIYQMAKAYYK